MVKLDLGGLAPFIKIEKEDLDAARAALDTLNNKSGAGAEFTGWLTLPEDVLTPAECAAAIGGALCP